MRPVLRLATRTFLISFLPVCIALAGGFVAMRSVVEQRARNGLRQNFHRTEQALEKMRSQYEQRRRRLVAVLSENAGLKAGIGLLRESSDRRQIQHTIEDQLREFAGVLDYDLLLVSDSQGEEVAGLIRQKGNELPLDPDGVPKAHSGVMEIRGQLYDVTSVPVNLGSENLGSITVGEVFDIGLLKQSGSAALLKDGKVVVTDLPAAVIPELERQLNGANWASTSEVELKGEVYLALPLGRTGYEDGYRVVSLQSIREATDWFLRDLRQAFTLVGAGAFLGVLLFSVLGSRSVAKPLTSLVAHLKDWELTGELRADFQTHSGTKEVNQLGEAFNQAATAMLESQARLDHAYLEFADTISQALDARDPYTANHSQRVSDFSADIARAMKLPRDQVEIVRLAARFHDIGKIGVPDAVLQKPGRLTEDEFEQIKLHPSIGKKILEKVGRFQEFVSGVELHHEDQDGGGYPHGLRGDDIPLQARIIKVADAFDAMTSDRAYRKGMPIEKAIAELRRCSGSQFDPQVVQTFLGLLSIGTIQAPAMIARKDELEEEEEFESVYADA